MTMIDAELVHCHACSVSFFVDSMFQKWPNSKSAMTIATPSQNQQNTIKTSIGQWLKQLTMIDGDIAHQLSQLFSTIVCWFHASKLTKLKFCNELFQPLQDANTCNHMEQNAMKIQLGNCENNWQWLMMILFIAMLVLCHSLCILCPKIEQI